MDINYKLHFSVCCYFFPRRSKYLPYHPVFGHPSVYLSPHARDKFSLSYKIGGKNLYLKHEHLVFSDLNLTVAAFPELDQFLNFT
jgi:hypothetical protein